MIGIWRAGRIGAIVQGALVVLVLVGLAVVIYRAGPEVAAYRWRMDYPYVILAFALYSLALGLAVAGWRAVMGDLGGKLSFWQDAKLYCLSNAAKRLPGSFWGVVGRVYLYGQKGVPGAITSVGLVLEALLIGVAALALAPLFIVFFSPFRMSAGAWGVLAGALGLCTMALHPRVLGWALGWLRRRLGARGAALPLRLGAGQVLRWGLIYAGVWLVGGLVLYCVVSVFTSVPLAQLPAVVGVWVMARGLGLLFYFIPAGLGVTEVTLAFLLSWYVAVPAALAAAVAMRLLITAGEVFWMLVSLRLG